MKITPVVAAIAAACLPMQALACASCGCTLTADWLSQGLVTQTSTVVGLRYDYIPQTQLRTDTRTVDRRAIAFPTAREIEKYTINHYLTASLDRQFNASWGLNIQVPFSYRPHATTDAGDTDLSYSHTGGLGDIRVTARRQAASESGAITGVQLGLQLPTGRIHERFQAGPDAGQAVDRGIQPGFGVTQVIAGVYRSGRLARGFDYIVQAQGQLPLYRHEDYRPGKIGQVTAGVHYTGWRGVTPQLQLNFRATERDRGVNSDTYNTGGEQLYVSPGLIATLSPRASAFVYVQVPVYQRLTGYQLSPRATASVGVQYRL